MRMPQAMVANRGKVRPFYKEADTEQKYPKTKTQKHPKKSNRSQFTETTSKII